MVQISDIIILPETSEYWSNLWMEILTFEWKSLNLLIWSGQGEEKLKLMLQNAKMT